MKWEWVWKNWGVFSTGLSLVIVPLATYLWRSKVAAYFERRKLLRSARLTEIETIKAQLAEVLSLLKPNGGSSLADSLARLERETQLNQSILMAVQDLSGLAFWRSDADGSCTHASTQLAEILGIDQSKVLGNGWVTAIHPEYRKAVSSEWIDAVGQHRRFSMDYPFRHNDGVKVWVHGEALPIFDSTGKFNGYVGVLTRISPPRNSKDA